MVIHLPRSHLDLAHDRTSISPTIASRSRPRSYLDLTYDRASILLVILGRFSVSLRVTRVSTPVASTKKCLSQTRLPRGYRTVGLARGNVRYKPDERAGVLLAEHFSTDRLKRRPQFLGERHLNAELVNLRVSGIITI